MIGDDYDERSLEAELYSPSPDGPRGRFGDSPVDYEDPRDARKLGVDLDADKKVRDRRELATALDCAAMEWGHLQEEDLATIARLDRFREVLVRCEGCRFVCCAQDAERLIQVVEAGGEHVRDVSLRAGDPALRWLYANDSRKQEYRRTEGGGELA